MRKISQSSLAAMLLAAASLPVQPAHAADEAGMPTDEAAAPSAPAALSGAAIIAAEPESWAMMIGGFLLAGVVLRRSRSVVSFV